MVDSEQPCSLESVSDAGAVCYDSFNTIITTRTFYKLSANKISFFPLNVAQKDVLRGDSFQVKLIFKGNSIIWSLAFIPITNSKINNWSMF